MDDRQKTFDYLKYGFTADDVVIRLKPINKKSIDHMIQLYNVPVGEPGHKFVEVKETYRWGYGYMEGDTLDWAYRFRGDEFYCDPNVGHGADLDDLCAIDFNFDGDWTEAEQADFSDRWYNGDPNDDDGRSGMAWVHDYQDEWQIEDEQIIVLGPVQFDIVDKKEYNKIYIEDYKPTTEENE